MIAGDHPLNTLLSNCIDIIVSSFYKVNEYCIFTSDDDEQLGKFYQLILDKSYMVTLALDFCVM